MPEIVADPPSPSCCHLFPGDGIQEYQRRSPDPSLSYAREGLGRRSAGARKFARQFQLLTGLRIRAGGGGLDA